jgi:transposase
MKDVLPTTREALIEHVAKLRAALAAERAAHRRDQAALEVERAARVVLEAERAEAIAERDRLREAYRNLQLEVELMRRRIVVAKAERIDTAQLELEFAEKLAALDALAGQLAPGTPSTPGAKPAAGSGDAQRTKRRRPSGRRDLRMLSIPEERIELTDPALEGKAPRIGTEDSYKVMWRRGGAVRVVFARVKYRVEPDPPTTDVAPTTATIITAELPPQMIARSLATPSLLAHVISDKLCDGLPLHRQEDRFARLGVTLDRGTMSRWQQDVGLTVGATVVEAMRADALAHAFCLATDATGVLVQPTRNDTGVRQPCRRGHFFVQIADADHVFFGAPAKPARCHE